MQITSRLGPESHLYKTLQGNTSPTLLFVFWCRALLEICRSTSLSGTVHASVKPGLEGPGQRRAVGTCTGSSTLGTFAWSAAGPCCQCLGNSCLACVGASTHALVNLHRACIHVANDIKHVRILHMFVYVCVVVLHMQNQSIQLYSFSENWKTVLIVSIATCFMKVIENLSQWRVAFFWGVFKKTFLTTLAILYPPSPQPSPSNTSSPSSQTPPNPNPQDLAEGAWLGPRSWGLARAGWLERLC